MRHGFALLLSVLLLWPPTSATAQEAKKKNADPENIGARDINKGSWNLYSLEREVALGEHLAWELERSLRLVEDRVVVAYVTEVAEQVARHSDLRVPLRVRVVDSDDIGAFALPGGYLYISTGLVMATQAEAELAGVMAHEIAHVAARHATKQSTKAQLWNWLSLPLLFAGGPVAYGVRQGLTLAVPLSFLKFSRDAEREADFLGLQYQYAAGYDPVAFVDFFERMKRVRKADASGIARAFSTHPMTRDRIVTAERTIEELLPPREEYVVSTSEYDAVRARLFQAADTRRPEKGTHAPVLRKRTSEEGPAANGKQERPL